MSATIDRATIAQLKAAVSLPTLIGQSVPLGRMGNVWTGLCPFHAEKSPSFGVYEDHYHCFGCGAHGDHISWLTTARKLSFHEAVQHLGGTLGREPDHPSSMGRPPSKTQPVDTVRIARRVWASGRDPAGTLAERYLNSRRLGLPEDCTSLRFLDECQRGSRRLEGGPYYAPALLAELTDPVTGEFVGVHRTFLLPDGSGKAPPITVGDITLSSKGILGNWGVIRLCDDTMVGQALALGEGLENSLTVAQYAHWTTIWSAGCANNIRNFPLLFGLESLSIFTDGDQAGRSAAAACAKRWAADGREVILHSPPAKLDWNGALFAKGGVV
jgi:CHC2 zinc finger/Toprim domain